MYVAWKVTKGRARRRAFASVDAVVDTLVDVIEDMTRAEPERRRARVQVLPGGIRK